ncbi:MAG TPA: amidohydrolase family protein [Candidatus Acidoferrales bacterium]|nr:amidohydrolase family protein [Candidatus Acidoferrales bacterium]
MLKRGGILLVVAVASSMVAAQNPPPTTQQFISAQAPVVALEHVRVIDGTGASPAEDQTVLIANGKIGAIGGAGQVTVPAGAKVLDLSGDSVLPGLVGMHDHLYYPAPSGRGRIPGAPAMYTELAFSFPRLYLACGVTSIRTTGSLEPYADLTLKSWIDAGRMPGPKIHITAPYLEGVGAFSLQMHELAGPADAVRMVNYWADQGFTSYKAYTHITRAELGAAIQAAHARHIKFTGHLCSVGFREAAALGIDDLEHGLVVDTEFVPGKQPDVCPPGEEQESTLANLDVSGAAVQETIRDLVAHHVAVTSTLPVFESSTSGRPPLQPRVLETMAPPARIDYLVARALVGEQNPPRTYRLKKEMQFEYDFARAGGMLLAGLDPTGNGGVLAGFGDQREVELLVEAGFTPLEAIHIATENGAIFLGEDDRIGTLQAGKQADIVVVQGDPSRKISDIENVVTVFKDGVGFDSKKLIDSVRGTVGLH